MVANSKFVKQIDIIFNALGADKVKQHANMLIHQLKILQNEAMKGMALAEKKNNPKLLSAWSDVSRQITTALKLQKDSGDYTVRNLKNIAERLGVVEAKAKALGKETNFKYKTGLSKYKDDIKELLELYTSLGGKINKNLVKKIGSDDSQDLQKANKILKERIRLLKEASKLNGIVDNKTYNSLVGKISNRSSAKGLYGVNTEIKQLIESNKQRIKEEAQLLKSIGKESSIVANSVSRLKKKYDSLKFSLDKTIISQERWTKSEHTEKAKRVVKNIEAKEKRLIRLSLAYKKVEKRLQEYIKLNDLARIRRANTNLQRLDSIINNEAVAFDNLSRNARRATEDLKKLSRVKWFIETSKRAVAYAGMYAGMFSVVNTIQNAIEYTNQLDQAQHQLAGVLGMTKEQASKATKQIEKMATVYGGTVEDIKNVALELGRAGVANKDIADATEVVIKMALLTGDSYNVATSALVSFNEVFGKQVASMYKGQDVLEIIGNKLAFVANESRMSTQDIGTFANYALAMSKQVGFSIDMVGALATAFNNMGNNASTIGTMIRRWGTLLSTTSPKVRKFWEAIKIDPNQLRRNLQKGGAVGEQAFKELVSKLGNLSKEELSTITADLGTLANQTIMATANGSERILKLFEELKRTTSGQFKGVRDVIDSNTKVWERFKNVLGSVADRIVDPALTKGANILKSIMGEDKNTSFKEWADNAQKLVDNVVTIIKHLSILGVSIAALKTKAVVFDLLTLAVKKYSTAVRLASIQSMRLGKSVSPLSASLGIIGKRLGAIGIAYTVFETLFYFINKSANEAERLNKALGTTVEQFKKLGNNSQADTINLITKQYTENLKKIQDLKAKIGIASRGRYFGLGSVDKEELTSLKAQLEKIKKQNDALRKKLNIMKDIHKVSLQTTDSINITTDNLNNSVFVANHLGDALWNSYLNAIDTANAVQPITTELYNAKIQALDLASALDSAFVGVKKQLLRAKLIAGEIDKTKYATLSFKIDSEEYDKKLKTLNDKFKQANRLKDGKEKEAILKRLTIESAKLWENQVSKANRYKETINSIEKEHKQKLEQLKEAQERLNLSKLSGTNRTKEELKLLKSKIEEQKNLLNNIPKGSDKYLTEETKLLQLQAQYNQKNVSLKNKIEKIGSKNSKLAQKLHDKQTEITAEIEKQKSILKQIEELKNNWFKFDEDSVKTAKEKYELTKKQVEALKTNSNKIKYEKAVTKEYKARLEYLKAQHEQLKEIYNIFNSGIHSIFKGDISGGFSSMWGSFADILVKPLESRLSSLLTKATSSIFSGLGTIAGGILGIGMSFLPNILQGLFGSTLTQAEIEAAKGRVEFSDKSITQLAEAFSKAENPLLPYTKRMTDYLATMKQNFEVVAKTLTNSFSFDVTGNNYVPYQSRGFLGFSNESRDLLSSGIGLNKVSFSGISGYAYNTEKVHEESFWGLFSSDYIKKTTKALDKATIDAFKEILDTGYKSIVDSASVFGKDVRSKLNSFSLNLGEIDLKGLSAEQINERLKNAFSEFFSKSINSLDGINKLVDRYKKFGEESYNTLGRIALEFEQASSLFNRYGIEFKDEAVKYTNMAVGATRGIFNDLFSVFDISLTRATQYTAQMKVLDIVEASGGLDKFTTNFNTFVDNLYTDEEKLKALNNSLTKSFSSLGVVMPKSKEEFKNLIQTFNVTSKESAKTYAELLKLSDSFAKLQDETKKLRDEQLNLEKDRYKKLIEWQKELNKRIADAWLGNLSYLNSAEKALKAKEIAKAYLEQGDVTSYLDMQQKSLEYSKTQAKTREEYALAFNRYIYDIKKSESKKTLDDVVKSLDELKAELKEVKEANIKSADNSTINIIKKLDEVVEAERETAKEIADSGVMR